VLFRSNNVTEQVKDTISQKAADTQALLVHCTNQASERVADHLTSIVDFVERYDTDATSRPVVFGTGNSNQHGKLPG